MGMSQIALDRHAAVLSQQQRVRRRQCENAFKHCARLRDIAESQIRVDRWDIARARHPRALEDRLHFRSKNKAAVALMIVKRLLAATVTRKKCVAGAGIVQREGKHSIELLHAVPSPFFVGVNDDFGIRACAKNVSFLHQLVVKLDVVVDFSVEANCQGAILVVYGLRSSIQIDD